LIFGSRSGSEFANFYEILKLVEFDETLLKEANNIDKNDLIINERVNNFIALLIDFTEKKTKNILLDQGEIELFQV